MAAGLQWTDALRRTDDPGRQIIWYETVHLPWQLLFGALLAWMMRKPRVPRKRISRRELKALAREAAALPEHQRRIDEQGDRQPDEPAQV